MSYRKLFYAANALMLAVFAWAFLKDFSAEWKPYQRNYYRMTAEALEKKASAEKDEKKAAELRAEAKRFRRAPLEVKQIIVADMNRFDRCITCHVGMDEYTNPSLKNDFKEHPYKAHPKVDEALVKAHGFQKFGCTSCHSGQGLATTKEAAHGWVKHWEQPMLKGVHIQGSCVKCHGNFDKVKGAEVAVKGRDLFRKHGCYGCHSINGWGGVVSVDLGDIADKPFERIAGYNFKKIRLGKGDEELKFDHHLSEWNIQNWILGHLVNDPAKVTPNDPFAKYNAEPIAPSGMPDFTKEIDRDGADAITAYLSGMTKENIPAKYYVHGDAHKIPVARNGKEVFQKYGCGGCHGLEAKQGRRNYNALGPGQSDPVKDMELGREPTLPDVMGTYTKDELIKKLEAGVPQSAVAKFNPKGPQPPLYMPAWKGRISPQEMSMLADWLLSIAKKDDSGF
jgi:cytochrome c551/c552